MFPRLLTIAIILIFSSCTDDYLVTREFLLTSKEWRMISFLNTSTNQIYQPLSASYQFMDNGTLVIKFADKQPEYTTWALMHKRQYLRIGNNVFKINTITTKLLGLRYGTADVFFTAIN